MLSNHISTARLKHTASSPPSAVHTHRVYMRVRTSCQLPAVRGHLCLCLCRSACWLLAAACCLVPAAAACCLWVPVAACGCLLPVGACALRLVCVAVDVVDCGLTSWLLACGSLLMLAARCTH
jgi:hypothetical protein